MVVPKGDRGGKEEDGRPQPPSLNKMGPLTLSFLGRRHRGREGGRGTQDIETLARKREGERVTRAQD